MSFKNKKIVFTIIFISAFLFLSGCRKKEENDTQKEPQITSDINEKAKLELTIFPNDRKVVQKLKNAAKLYMQENENIQIWVLAPQEGVSYKEQRDEKLKQEDAIDIFQIQGPADCADLNGMLEDFTKAPWIKHVLPAALEGVTFDNKIYGLPSDVEGYGFLYNEEIFKSAGIDTKTLTDFESISHAFIILQKKINSGKLKKKYPNLKAVTVLPGKEKNILGGLLGNAVLANEFTGVKAAYNSPFLDFKYAQQYKKLIDLQAKYSIQSKNIKNLIQVSGNNAVKNLAEEQAAVILQTDRVTETISDINEKVLQKLDFLPLSLENVNEYYLPVNITSYWAVNKNSDSKEKKAAKDFLNWLYQSEEGKKIVTEDLELIPPFSNYESFSSNDILRNKVRDYVTTNSVVFGITEGAPEGFLNNVLGLGVQQYLAGLKNWDDVVSAVKQSWADEKEKVGITAVK